ncbi:hypothetical protein [Mastigocoleus testarum]|uniref:Tetratricopeptide repeat protein n=1 Tax=Mastigocoleus testarum BC008 TaxID=371196 RepID=A0A0V8A0K1_9CYAN|nr:hypothetical protein [Mastigocoleus testarum]KST70312.1 hypothetical protein BC008_44730 [Mastigocoleus testarum BC008]
MLVDTDRFSWFEVPENIKKLLMLAADNWENNSEAEKYINQALAKTGKNTDVLIAAYRYFYYKYNYPMALQIAEKVIDIIREVENFTNDWEELKPVLIARKEEARIRLFLNAYAASGLVLAKLGKLEQAKKICIQVKEIDDNDEFGAGVLLDILTRPPEEDD